MLSKTYCYYIYVDIKPYALPSFTHNDTIQYKNFLMSKLPKDIQNTIVKLGVDLSQAGFRISVLFIKKPTEHIMRQTVDSIYDAADLFCEKSKCCNYTFKELHDAMTFIDGTDSAYYESMKLNYCDTHGLDYETANVDDCIINVRVNNRISSMFSDNLNDLFRAENETTVFDVFDFNNYGEELLSKTDIEKFRNNLTNISIYETSDEISFFSKIDDYSQEIITINQFDCEDNIFNYRISIVLSDKEYRYSMSVKNNYDLKGALTETVRILSHNELFTEIVKDIQSIIVTLK